MDTKRDIFRQLVEKRATANQLFYYVKAGEIEEEEFEELKRLASLPFVKLLDEALEVDDKEAIRDTIESAYIKYGEADVKAVRRLLG